MYYYTISRDWQFWEYILGGGKAVNRPVNLPILVLYMQVSCKCMQFT